MRVWGGISLCEEFWLAFWTPGNPSWYARMKSMILTCFFFQIKKKPCSFLMQWIFFGLRRFGFFGWRLFSRRIFVPPSIRREIFVRSRTRLTWEPDAMEVGVTTCQGRLTVRQVSRLWGIDHVASSLWTLEPTGVECCCGREPRSVCHTT